MNFFHKILFMTVFIVGCGTYNKNSHKVKNKTYSNSKEEKKPSWINNPSEYCSLLELCAVGSGTGRMTSNSNARSNMLKIFETKIDSIFEEKITSNSFIGIIKEIQERVTETTKGTLKSLEIKETWEGPDEIFSLAVINKNKMRILVKNEIKEIDNKMKVWMGDESLSSVYKLKKLYIQRKGLNNNYQILTDSKIDQAFTYKQIYEKSKNKLSKIYIKVKLDEESPKQIQPELIKLLTDMDIKVINKNIKNKMSTHLISGKFKPKKNYLKVKGFKKYKFILELYAQKNDSAKTGSLQFDTVQVGRTYNQALEKALPLVKDFIRKNIDNLNIN
jgi:hypothetical protein